MGSGNRKEKHDHEENHYHNRSVSDDIQYDGDGEVHKALSATCKEKVLREWMRPKSDK
jgi:hypothetical protein